MKTTKPRGHFGTCKNLLLASSVLATSCFAATAQEAEDGEDGVARLDTVTVTAQRREESLQDVPIAISAFSSEDLLNKQIKEPLDLLQNVPNIYGGNNTGLGSANTYFIRGLGNAESIATFDPPVGTYVDEVYIARQNANNTSFFDVEQIEVLRGPQGTLFGRNTTGGAVSIRMRKPSEEFRGYVEAEYGSFDRIVVKGSVDVPLSESVLTKLSGFWLEDDGFVDALATGETLNGQKAFGVRGDLRFLIGDAITWDLSADYVEDEGLNLLNYNENASPLGSSVPGGLTTNGRNRVSNTGISTEEGEGTLVEQLLAGQGLGAANESFSVNSNFALELNEDSALNLIVGYRSLDQEFIIDFFDGGLGGEQFTTGGFAVANDGSHDQFSAELKYTGSYFDGALDVVSGLYYFHEDNSTDFADVFTINVGPPGTIVPVPLLLADRVLDNTLDSFAAYTQADWRPIDRLTLTLGLRWTQEDKDIEYTDNRDLAATPDPTTRLDSANIAAAGIPLDQTQALLTPRAAIEFEATDDISVFASYTKGFKSGGWNARSPNPALIQPFDREIANNYEIGWRSSWFEDRLRFNATGFYLDVEDVQTPSAFVGPDGAITFLTQNFSDLENLGVEFDTTVAVTEALTLNASLGLQDAQYRNPDPAIIQQIADCVASDGADGGGLGIVAPDCDLGDTVRTPNVTFSFGAVYNLEIPSLGLLFTPSVNVRRVSSTFVGTSNLANGFENGYTLLSLGASLTHDSGWTFSVDCQNCTDEAYVVSNLPPTTYVSDPRRIGVRIRKDF